MPRCRQAHVVPGARRLGPCLLREQVRRTLWMRAGRAVAAAQAGLLHALQVGYDAGLQPTERLRTRAAAVAAAAAATGASGRGKR
jgi:hypothetical protein